MARVASPVDSSPPADATRPKVKTTDLKTKTPDQPKQQKGVDITVTSSMGESDNVAKGVDVEEMIARIDDIIAPLLVGCDPTDQETTDGTLQ